jgi:hypothetical protein
MTTLPCPDCGIVHDDNCRRYLPINVDAALWVAASLLIIVAAVPGVIR